MPAASVLRSWAHSCSNRATLSLVTVASPALALVLLLVVLDWMVVSWESAGFAVAEAHLSRTLVLLGASANQGACGVCSSVLTTTGSLWTLYKSSSLNACTRNWYVLPLASPWTTNPGWAPR